MIRPTPKRAGAPPPATACTARDPELGKIREGLARLTERVDAGDVDTERIDLLVRIARARVYVIKIASEVAHRAAEIRELEDYAADLEERYEELKNGHADGSAGRSRARR